MATRHGLFYQANVSQNLATICQQITLLLFAKRHVRPKLTNSLCALPPSRKGNIPHSWQPRRVDASLLPQGSEGKFRRRFEPVAMGSTAARAFSAAIFRMSPNYGRRLRMAKRFSSASARCSTGVFLKQPRKSSSARAPDMGLRLSSMLPGISRACAVR